MSASLESYRTAPLPSKVWTLKHLKLTDKQLAYIKNLILCNFVINRAANMTGISMNAYYDWKENYPHFAKAMEISRDRFVDAIEGKFAELIEEGNPQAVIFGLKTIGRDRGYAEKQDVSLTGVAGIKVIFGDSEK